MNKQLVKAVLAAAASAAIACASCSIAFPAGTATLRVSLAIPGNRAAGTSGSPRLLNPNTAYVIVEVSGPDMSTISARSDIDATTGTANLSIRGIPVSNRERGILVSAYSAGGLLLSSGSCSRMLNPGSNDVSLPLVPARTDATLAAGWHRQIVPPSSLAYVAELSLPSADDYCVSLGYTSAQFWVYDAQGRPSEKVAGSPEQWYIVRGDSAARCYVMVQSGNAQETLTVEKAVYVSPGASGTEDGSRNSPYARLTQSIYAEAAADCRFLLARGIYENTQLEVLPGKSIYGGFDPSSWARRLGPGESMTELRGSAGASGFVRCASAVDGDTVIDGLWIRADAIDAMPTPATSTIYTAFFEYSPSIQNCRITGPLIRSSAKPNNVGFQALNAGYDGTVTTRIVGNLISAGWIDSRDATNSATLNGLYISNGSDRLLIANNEIDGGSAASGSIAAHIDGTAAYFSSGAWFLNNTVGGGRLSSSGGSSIVGISSATSPSGLHIIDNVIFDSETSTVNAITDCLLAVNDPENRPIHLMNNYSGQRALHPDESFHSDAYHFAITGAFVNSDILNLNVGSNPAGNCVNNYSTDFNPQYFVKYGDPDQLDAYALDRDWALSSAAPQVLRSNAIGYQTLLGAAVGMPAEFLPYLLRDRRGRSRPVSGWSMGAYQY